MITEEEYRKAQEVVKQYKAEKLSLKYQNMAADLPGTTLLKDCQLSTRTMNLMRSIGDWFIYGHRFPSERWKELTLKDFDGLERGRLQGILGLGPGALMEIETLLARAGIQLK